MIWVILMKIKCIYCLKEKHKRSFRKREHVIPQSFGKFKNNLVLHEVVCDDCNQYFGDNLERDLSRDSLEAIRRYMHGIKSKNPSNKYKRIKSKIAEGKNKGLIVFQKPSENGGMLEIEPVVQVGFFHKDRKEYDYFEPGDIKTASELEKAGYQLKGKNVISVIARHGKEFNDLLAFLKGKGIDVKIQEERNMGDDIEDRKPILVKGTIQIDPILYGAISKIAFNYLAYIQSREFVLSSEFDEIRNFIRYNEGKARDIFRVNQLPILHNDKRLRRIGAKETDGHLIVVEWEGRDLVGRVSLFNDHTYKIILSRHYGGVWTPIKNGHLFDVQSRETSKLESYSRRLMI